MSTKFMSISLLFAISHIISFSNGSQFVYVDTPTTWNDAELHCIKLGGHLSPIHSLQDNHAVFSLCSTQCWIGAMSTSLGVFSWTDNTMIKYHNWSPGEPSNDGLCVWIYGDSSEFPGIPGAWNDISCSEIPAPFICFVSSLNNTSNTSNIKTLETVQTKERNKEKSVQRRRLSIRSPTGSPTPETAHSAQSEKEKDDDVNTFGTKEKEKDIENNNGQWIIGIAAAFIALTVIATFGVVLYFKRKWSNKIGEEVTIEIQDVMDQCHQTAVDSQSRSERPQSPVSITNTNNATDESVQNTETEMVEVKL